MVEEEGGLVESMMVENGGDSGIGRVGGGDDGDWWFWWTKNLTAC